MDTVTLDLRDERGRFFTRVKLPKPTYDSLLLYAALAGITFEELLHRAIGDFSKVALSA